MRLVFGRRRLGSVLAATLLALGCGGEFNAPLLRIDSFSVTPTPAGSVADGASVVTLVATIDSTTPASDASVEFKTSLGSFVGGTTATSITAKADPSGKARAQLKAPTSPGTALITATFANVTKTIEITFAPSASKGITGFVASPTPAPADGFSLVTLKFIVDTAPRPSSSTVGVSTTAGTLLGGNAPVNAAVNDSGFAYAILKAPTDSGIALVTATLGSVSKYFQVLFSPALPDQVQLTTTAFELKAGTANQTTLTATLLRRIGAPSPGVAIVFSADTLGGTTGDFGVFSPRTTTSTTSPVTTRFTGGTSAYRGKVTLRVRASRGGVVVSDSTALWIVD